MSNLANPQPFDPAAAVNAIRDKIRGAMLDIIPDEQWNTLIKAEVEAFTKDHVERRGYGGDVERPAGFKVIVRGLLEENAKARVTALLASPEWQQNWSTGEAGEAIQKYVTEHAAEILNKWVSSAVQQVVSQLQYVGPR
jgi:hypothetical protein